MGRQGLDIITMLLLAGNIIPSIMAFRDFSLMEKYKFNVGAVLHRKEYYRLITGAFLHVNPSHLILNMISLYFIGRAMPTFFGEIGYLVIYFGAMLGGKGLAILVHKDNPGYSAVGASGAIAGIIFAFVYLVPTTSFLLFFIIPCPAWLFALLFTGISIFGMRTGMGNIGHEAHLGGAVTGMILGILFRPQFLTANYWVVLLLLIPTGILMYVVIYRRDLLFRQGQRPFKMKDLIQKPGPRLVRNKADEKFVNEREELDFLLDKVQQKGYSGLSKKEKHRLDELAGK